MCRNRVYISDPRETVRASRVHTEPTHVFSAYVVWKKSYRCWWRLTSDQPCLAKLISPPRPYPVARCPLLWGMSAVWDDLLQWTRIICEGSADEVSAIEAMVLTQCCAEHASAGTSNGVDMVEKTAQHLRTMGARGRDGYYALEGVWKQLPTLLNTDAPLSAKGAQKMINGFWDECSEPSDATHKPSPPWFLRAFGASKPDQGKKLLREIMHRGAAQLKGVWRRWLVLPPHLCDVTNTDDDADGGLWLAWYPQANDWRQCSVQQADVGILVLSGGVPVTLIRCEAWTGAIDQRLRLEVLWQKLLATGVAVPRVPWSVFRQHWSPKHTKQPA